MNPPDKIFIQPFPDCTWSTEIQAERDPEYVRVDALRQWMHDYLKVIEFTEDSKGHIIGAMNAYQNIINRLEKL